jgi:DNA polymerase elongation subunit (family B)
MSSVVNAYLEGDEEHVRLLHRAEDGCLDTHRVLADFCVYFRRDEVDEALVRGWRKDPLCAGYRTEGDWLRTRWRGWNARRGVVHEMHERGVPTYEGDVSPVKRWMADHPEVEIQKPRRVYLDIETDSRVPLGEAKEKGARVLVWSLVDEAGNHAEGVLEEDTDPAERALLERLYRMLDPFDQICAWNGDEFDFPILGKRTKARRISGGFPRRWLRMDHMVLYRRMNTQVAESGEEKQSYALSAVAHAQLGEGKDDVDASKSYQLWEAGGEACDALVRYCYRDTDLMRRIEAKTGYLALHQTIAEICGLFPDSYALLPTAQMDARLLRLGRGRGIHFPTATKSVELNQEQYKGSYNKAPPERAGILKGVHVVDFSGMYASIMVSWNMSFETRVMGPPSGPLPLNRCRSPKTGICFRTDVLGVVPETIERLLAERKKWSAVRDSLPPGTPEAHDAERRTNGYKVTGNAMYGAQGNRGCRFYDKRVAESVSQTGAWLAEKTEWALVEREKGASVIYVDTDGLWLTGVDRAWTTGAVAWLNAEVYPRLLKECGCAKNIVKLAYEKEFERVIFVGAKNYIGRFAHYKGTEAVAGSRPEIKGVAYKRGDSAKLTREMMAEAIDLLVGGMKVVAEPGPTEDIARYEEMVTRWRTRILEAPLAVEDVQTVKGLSQEVKHYASRKSTKGNVVADPPHVRVAKMLQARGAYVGMGTKIAYVVTDACAKPQAVIPACDYEGVCDRRYLWDSVVWGPTRALLESAFPAHDWAQFDAPGKRATRELFPEEAPKPKRVVRKAKPRTGNLFGADGA